jgi:hypothetical protein
MVRMTPRFGFRPIAQRLPLCTTVRLGLIVRVGTNQSTQSLRLAYPPGVGREETNT